MAMKIILIGYMGSGKSTIGKRLAFKMNLPFVDMDNEIEKQESATISEIFQTKGEMYFRELERNFIFSMLPDSKEAIYATGGGMPCFYDNMEQLNRLGTTIYLKRPTSELLHRLMNSKKERPLTKDKTKTELYAFMENQLILREPFYAKAKIIAPRNQQDTDSLLELISEYHSSQHES